jgi:hypothetical protein
VTANHHTDIAAGAAATAATINAPIGQLDAKLTHDATGYFNNGTTATTATTAGNWYAVSLNEVSFTPAYTGQTFICTVACGGLYSGTAGTSSLNTRITDSVNAVVSDFRLRGSSTATSSAGANSIGGAFVYTAGAGDVGVVRKLALYVTHSVNGASVTVAQVSLYVITH